MIPRTSIDEANKHLNLLHGRVNELEKKVAEQHDALLAKDEDFQNKLKDLSVVKNAEINALKCKLLGSEQTVAILQQQALHKDEVIATLQHNFGVLETLLNHRVSVQHLLQAMKEAEKNIREVNITGESTAELQGQISSHNKDLREGNALVNGFCNGVLSSPESRPEQRMLEPHGKGGEKRGKTQKLSGKEFYL